MEVSAQFYSVKMGMFLVSNKIHPKIAFTGVVTLRFLSLEV
jgi:hypothetical protein